MPLRFGDAGLGKQLIREEILMPSDEAMKAAEEILGSQDTSHDEDVRWAAQIMDDYMRPGWISVEDRLPEGDERNQEVVALYFEYGRYWNTCDSGDQICPGIHTHWLPHPPAPDAEEVQK